MCLDLFQVTLLLAFISFFDQNMFFFFTKSTISFCSLDLLIFILRNFFVNLLNSGIVIYLPYPGIINLSYLV